jgi:predicted Fe-Mo cluster-binding NifX family protein
MPYNIAVTSSHGDQVDLHFGRADAFYILQIDEESGSWKILEKKELPPSFTCAGRERRPTAAGRPDPVIGTGGEGCISGCGENRHESMMARIKMAADLLVGCIYLLTAKIGPKPSDLLKHAGITALEAPFEIKEAIPKLNRYHLKYGKINQERKNG